jgi:hypothetical protein
VQAAHSAALQDASNVPLRRVHFHLDLSPFVPSVSTPAPLQNTIADLFIRKVELTQTWFHALFSFAVAGLAQGCTGVTDIFFAFIVSLPL